MNFFVAIASGIVSACAILATYLFASLSSISLSKFGLCKTSLNNLIASDFSSESVRSEKLL